MNAGELRFDAPWSRSTWIVSAVVLVVLLAAAAIMAAVSWQQWQSGHITPALLMALAAAALLILIVVAAVWAPRHYVIRDCNLVVWRLGPKLLIPAADIQGVQPITLSRAIRVCGFGGLFGAWGWFSSRELRFFRAYVTRSGPLVAVMRRRGCPVVLSPENPERFIAAVRAILPVDPPANDAAP